MQDDLNKNEDKNDSDKIIHFPNLENRKSRDKEKQDAEKEAIKLKKDQIYQEKLWREQYRAQQAKKMAAAARGKKTGKASFINWDKIPPFTGTMSGILLLVHILTILTLNNSQLVTLHEIFGFTPAVFTGYIEFKPLHLLSPFTSLFLHDGWMHVLTNTLMLLVMGSFCERLLGMRLTGFFYFAGGLIGSLTYFAMLPQNPNAVIGASGAIASLFAINMLIMYDSGALQRFQNGNDKTKFLLIWVAIIIVTGVAFGGVAWQAHLGGFLGGSVLYTLWKKGKIRL